MAGDALRRVIPVAWRRAAGRGLAERRSARLRGTLEAIARDSRPILAGPWLGEVGFELLYWVPWLRWVARTFDIAPDRWLVLSRGGTANWYADFAGTYLDAFDELDATGFRELHDRRVHELGEQKQTRLTQAERDLIDASLRRAGIRDWIVLHPSRMYDLFYPYWWGHTALDWVHRHAIYERFAAPARLSLMPDGAYTAVKFYFNECFPGSDANRRFVEATVDALGAAGPVMALSTGLNIDDHGAPRVDRSRVQHLPEGVAPAQNLHVQSAVVAGAERFVGTYGGFSYLAPFYGVRSLAFYSDPGGFSTRHLDMARSAFDRMGVGGFLDVRVAAEAQAA
jgi:hypothetical protein